MPRSERPALERLPKDNQSLAAYAQGLPCPAPARKRLQGLGLLNVSGACLTERGRGEALPAVAERLDDAAHHLPSSCGEYSLLRRAAALLRCEKVPLLELAGAPGELLNAYVLSEFSPHDGRAALEMALAAWCERHNLPVPEFAAAAALSCAAAAAPPPPGTPSCVDPRVAELRMLLSLGRSWAEDASNEDLRGVVVRLEAAADPKLFEVGDRVHLVAQRAVLSAAIGEGWVGTRARLVEERIALLDRLLSVARGEPR